MLVAGAVADKPARLVAPGEPLELVGPRPRFVSRGGEKLDAALDRFAVPVAGRTALDAGASTGGFTDCLLQRGAASVIALDVGHGHLDLRLRQDPRVTVRERTNVRHLRLDEPVDLVVADLSFISLRTVATALVDALRPGPAGDLVLLIKPQFEAGRVEVSRGKGVVRAPATWAGAIEGVHTAFAAAGAAMMGLMVSPLLGAEGNVEFLAHLRRDGGAPAQPLDIHAVVAEAAARP